MKDRRTKEGYKLRVYMDQIKEIKAMSDAEWVDQWVKYAGKDDVYVNRLSWLGYLEGCALKEAEKMAQREAA